MTSRISIDVITLLRELRCQYMTMIKTNFQLTVVVTVFLYIARSLRSKLGGAAPEKNRATSSQHLLIEMLHTCASVGTMQIVEKLILRRSLCQDPPEYDDIPERPVR